jgi:hypothetical protein
MLDDNAIAVMQKHGLTVHAVPPDAMSEWEQTARAHYPKLTAKIVPAETVAEVERLRGEYRASQKGK